MFAKSSILTGVIVVAHLFLTALPASAQRWGPGQQGPNWNRSDDGGYSGGGGRREPTYYSEAPATTSQSFYRASGPTDSRVFIQMRVPEGAQVWFGDAATRQTGTTRQFVSPPLAAGGVYQVRVQWRDRGQIVDQTRPVTVQPGDRVNLEFGASRAQ